MKPEPVEHSPGIRCGPAPVPKIIWACWFQGRDDAPAVVKTCLRSWERLNPDWEFRFLDATSVERYIDLRQYIDLDRQTLTAASLSDIARILLLHEYGGVWTDATLLCNQPLDEWLPAMMQEGFFAFAAPAPNRPLSSWFIGAAPHNYLISNWCRRTIEYWSSRQRTEDYFWFHHLFRQMCDTDHRAMGQWSRVPKVSADGPHAVQFGGCMSGDTSEALETIDWATPVFKLTHRLPQAGVRSGSLMEHLVRRIEKEHGALAPAPDPAPTILGDAAPKRFASLKVSTENLGDHIQIISGLRLLSRLGIHPTHDVDRDNEIRSAPGLPAEAGPVGILLNGWFKTNWEEWPPHPSLVPLIYGFHIRLLQCPELISDASIEFFRQHQPIGCRDVYTERLLRLNGVEAFTSHCLSLTFSRRVDHPETQTEIFVVSRDERIRTHLPESIGPYSFVSHYSGTSNFAANLAKAQQLIDAYRSRARLVITTLLHAALPAIAMGIPVVVFYPLNAETAHASDRERFSSLEDLVRVYRFEEIDRVDWNPVAADVGELKLRILDGFYEMAARWRTSQPPPLGPIAPFSALPPQ